MPKHRTAGLTRLGAGLGALAAAAALAPSPAAAVTVQASTSVGVDWIDEAFLTSDRTDLDVDTAVALDPGPGASVSVTQTTPGFIRASDSGTALVTNLLPDEAITVVITDSFWLHVLVSLDQPGEAGRGVSRFIIRRGTTALDGGLMDWSLRADDEFCWLPCDIDDEDAGSWSFAMDLAPGETARLRYDAYALAVAPVPLPASAWLSLAGLGGLLLARQGRRGRGSRGAVTLTT